ncbi:alpha/beta hydrolase [Alteromonadaceae bacterium M269]|nr:alpha/beta hydrolase [Alteromonadaceae bacterium M269]
MKSLQPTLLWAIGLLALINLDVNAKALQLPDIQVVPIQDSATERRYDLYVKLPENYEADADKKYPVIYYTDATWHVELLSAATAFLIEDAILVGISWQTDMDEALVNEAGAHVSRYRDYSISESSNAEHQAKYQFGQANRHLAFIRNDVFKYVENNYRADSNNRTYFGYSLGGQFGAYALLAQPDTFKNYVLGSPSVRRLPQLKSIANKDTEHLSVNVFISYGSEEKELSEHVDAFVAYLKSRKYQHLSVTQEVPEGSHQTAFPMTGVRSMAWLANLLK